MWHRVLATIRRQRYSGLAQGDQAAALPAGGNNDGGGACIGTRSAAFVEQSRLLTTDQTLACNLGRHQTSYFEFGRLCVKSVRNKYIFINNNYCLLMNKY